MPGISKSTDRDPPGIIKVVHGDMIGPCEHR